MDVFESSEQLTNKITILTGDLVAISNKIRLQAIRKIQELIPDADIFDDVSRISTDVIVANKKNRKRTLPQSTIVENASDLTYCRTINNSEVEVTPEVETPGEPAHKQPRLELRLSGTEPSAKKLKLSSVKENVVPPQTDVFSNLNITKSPKLALNIGSPPAKRSCLRVSPQAPEQPPPSLSTTEVSRKPSVVQMPKSMELTPQRKTQLLISNEICEQPDIVGGDNPVSGSSVSKTRNHSSLLTDDSDAENDTVSPLINQVQAPSSSSPSAVSKQTQLMVATPLSGQISSTISRLVPRSTPWSNTSGPTWLSRLGWFNGQQQSQQQKQQQQQVPKSQNVAKKSLTTLAKQATPNPCSISATRLPKAGKLNVTMGLAKANCSTISEKKACVDVNSSSIVHRSSTASTTARLQQAISRKLSTAEDRRLRVIAEQAAKMERHRRLEQQREEERRAKARAIEAHRQAVRANAERAAQEKLAAMARKFEAEKQRMQNITLVKDKPSALKTSISVQPPIVSVASKPLAPVCTNVPPSTWSTTQSKNVGHNATTPPNVAAGGQLSGSKKEPFMSYDLTGILSDYNSDSEGEQRREKRPIPPWAKTGSTELFQWVSNTYKNGLQWRHLFRPAERVHFDDSELFNGYKFRMRPRGSSAVWLEPPPTSS